MLMSHETVSESRTPNKGLLIVHGKNIGVGSTQDDIRRDNFHLSRESRFNALAAGMIWQPGMDVLFSTGATVPGLPSEAEAMKHYMQAHLHGVQPIPDSNTLLEEISIDTAGNAEEVARMLEQMQYSYIALLSVGHHIKNATRLFNKYGVEIDDKFASEDIVRNRSPRHAAIVEAWEVSDRVKKERQKERVRSVLLHTIDPKGKLLRQVTERMRG